MSSQIEIAHLGPLQGIYFGPTPLCVLWYTTMDENMNNISFNHSQL